MCEVKACPRAGRWWIQRAAMNILVCTQHLPGEIDRLQRVDWQTADPSYKLTPNVPVTVKQKFPHPHYPMSVAWR
jgi:hypothetical protein